MSRFRYKAYDRSGAVVEGDIPAADQQAAIAALQDKGLLPVFAEPAEGGGQAGVTRKPSAVRGPRLTGAQRAGLFRQLTTLAEAGLPMDRALRVAAGMQRERAPLRLLEALHARVTAGASLGEAMAHNSEDLTPAAVAAVSAGERGGVLASALKDVGEGLAREEALRATIRGAMTYPLVVMGLAVVVLVLLIAVVLPRFEPMFLALGREPPAATAALIAFGRFLSDYGLFVLAGLLLLGVGLRLWWRSAGFGSRLERFALRVPLLGTYLRTAASERTGRLLSVLLRAGTPLDEALRVTAGGVGLSAARGALSQAAGQVRAGARVSDSLERAQHGAPLFVPAMTEFLRLGEETGRLGEMMAKLADLTRSELEAQAARFTALITPTITIGLGLAVGLVILTLVSAVLDVYDLAV